MDAREMSNAVAASWRALWTDYRRLGVVDFKWVCAFFVGIVLWSWLIRESILRRVERRDRLLRLVSAAEAANDELRRRGADLQIETADVLTDL